MIYLEEILRFSINLTDIPLVGLEDLYLKKGVKILGTLPGDLFLAEKIWRSLEKRREFSRSIPEGEERIWRAISRNPSSLEGKVEPKYSSSSGLRINIS